MTLKKENKGMVMVDRARWNQFQTFFKAIVRVSYFATRSSMARVPLWVMIWVILGHAFPILFSSNVRTAHSGDHDRLDHQAGHCHDHLTALGGCS
jgi:hypothetical protein